MYGYGGPVSCLKAQEAIPQNPPKCRRGQLVGGRPQHIGQFFLPVSCPVCTEQDDRAWEDIPRLPRYLVHAHLADLLFAPRLKKRIGPASYDLAIHVRRGDKATEQRPEERISMWIAETVTDAAAALLNGSKKWDRGTSPRPAIFLASDDKAYSMALQSSLESRLGADVTRLANPSAIPPGKEAASICNATCITPLLQLVDSFARSRALLLNTRSNVGSYLLTQWPAPNADQMPLFVDMDSQVRPEDLSADHFWCSLPHGSRSGLCSGVVLPAMRGWRPTKTLPCRNHGRRLMKVSATKGRSSVVAHQSGAKTISKYQREPSLRKMLDLDKAQEQATCQPIIDLLDAHTRRAQLSKRTLVHAERPQSPGGVGDQLVSLLGSMALAIVSQRRLEIAPQAQSYAHVGFEFPFNTSYTGSPLWLARIGRGHSQPRYNFRAKHHGMLRARRSRANSICKQFTARPYTGACWKIEKVRSSESTSWLPFDHCEDTDSKATFRNWSDLVGAEHLLHRSLLLHRTAWKKESFAVTTMHCQLQLAATLASENQTASVLNQAVEIAAPGVRH
jgi:hypothetical protein